MKRILLIIALFSALLIQGCEVYVPVDGDGHHERHEHHEEHHEHDENPGH
jgi:hypothetical protein